MSFREVVDSASVASCRVEESFCEVVDSTPQASFREVVVSACSTSNTRTYSGMYEFRTRCHDSSGLADYFLYIFPVTSTTRITDGQSVSAMHVMLSVLFCEWAHRCPSAGSWIARVASCLIKVSFCGVG